jgi:hypothetical protein
VSAARVIGLVSGFALLALMLVHLRAEQTRSAASLLRKEARRMELRRELWELQTRSARLRTPQRVIDSAELLPTDLAPPAQEKPLRGPSRLVVQKQGRDGKH